MRPLVNFAYDVYVKGCAGYVMISFFIFVYKSVYIFVQIHTQKQIILHAQKKPATGKSIHTYIAQYWDGKQKLQLEKHINVVNFVRCKGSLKCSYNLTLSIV